MWSPSSDTASFVPDYFLHPIAPAKSISTKLSASDCSHSLEAAYKPPPG